MWTPGVRPEIVPNNIPIRIKIITSIIILKEVVFLNLFVRKFRKFSDNLGRVVLHSLRSIGPLFSRYEKFVYEVFYFRFLRVISALY